MTATNENADASTDTLNAQLDEMMAARMSLMAGDISWTEYRLRINNAKAIVQGQMTQEQSDGSLDELRGRGH